MIGIRWISAQQMLHKLRQTIGERDLPYRLSRLVEIDDAFMGCKHRVTYGRGAESKTAILAAVEHSYWQTVYLRLRHLLNPCK